MFVGVRVEDKVDVLVLLGVPVIVCGGVPLPLGVLVTVVLAVGVLLDVGVAVLVEVSVEDVVELQEYKALRVTEEDPDQDNRDVGERLMLYDDEEVGVQDDLGETEILSEEVTLKLIMGDELLVGELDTIEVLVMDPEFEDVCVIDVEADVDPVSDTIEVVVLDTDAELEWVGLVVEDPE